MDEFESKFWLAWIVGAIVSLGFLGVIIWAIVRIVSKWA